MKVFKYILVIFAIFASLSIASAQNQKVTGTVYFAADKSPVTGAYVQVEGSSKIGTATDLDGNFELSVPSSAKYLIVTFLGSKEARVEVASKVVVYLEDDSEMLEGAVVNGMQTVDRRMNTGSVVKVKAEEANISGMADISRSLEGRAAGVSVQNVSGTFGTAPKIRVRGATSIYGSSKPLWVVDGVIMEDVMNVSADDLSSGNANTLISSAIAGLNSDDIESFDILKDGSATSIYGARAMAGVIVVTTKRGKAGQSRLSYTGEYTYRLKPSYDTFNIMNSQDQMAIYQELEQKGYLN
ncbi:MAG: TonB-dependent receptor plug domain-containing protein, partial [Bacteroidales bacterium]|nr:TonB-dependent receptor plug domain-containing protein [Bacteroidales bacterium]